MPKNNALVIAAIGISFMLAFSFMIIPMNASIKWLRPDLVTLVLIYWIANVPGYIGIYFAFMVGLLFDLLTGMLLGTTGVSLAIIAFLTMNLRLRLRIYRYWQKFAIIMLLVGCAQLIRLWIQIAIGHTPGSFTYWLCTITSALAWPLVHMLLNTYKRTLNIR